MAGRSSGEVLPEGVRAERSLVGFVSKKNPPPFSSLYLTQVFQSLEFPELFLVISTDRKGKMFSVLGFSLPQSKDVEQGNEESY